MELTFVRAPGEVRSTQDSNQATSWVRCASVRPRRTVTFSHGASTNCSFNTRGRQIGPAPQVMKDATGEHYSVVF